jgi:hypothetical protein
MDDISPEEIVAGSMRAGPSRLEEALFGTTRPAEIVRFLRDYCLEHLGRAMATLLFFRRGVGVVFGVRLVSGEAVVVKVHRRDIVGRHLDGVLRVQAYLAERGLGAPRPLAEPVKLEHGIATAEELLEWGVEFDPHAPAVRSAMADALCAFVTTARPLLGSVRLDAAPPFGLDADRRWPTPHDLRFDLELPRGEWIDERADDARTGLLQAEGDEVIGHTDWRAENLRIDDGRVVAIFDWDSVAVLPEPALVGGAAAGFTADWSDPGREPRPSRDESRGFVRDYEFARGHPFTDWERESADAAYVYALAYNARCEHSDVVRGVFSDPGIEHGWRGLLKATEHGPLIGA